MLNTPAFNVGYRTLVLCRFGRSWQGGGGGGGVRGPREDVRVGVEVCWHFSAARAGRRGPAREQKEQDNPQHNRYC